MSISAMIRFQADIGIKQDSVRFLDISNSWQGPIPDPASQAREAGHMIRQDRTIGIDVSKHRLDVHLHDGPETRFTNDDEGRSQLVNWALEHGATRAGLEATGGYERAAACILAEAGLDIFILHPSDVKAFARSLRIRAKNDALDAAVIARFVAVQSDGLVAWQPDDDARALIERVALRRSLVDTRTRIAGLLESRIDPFVRDRLERQHAALACEIRLVERAIEQKTCEHPDLADRTQRLRTVPGIGAIAAATLIGSLPELGTLSNKKIAALAGLAPHPNQSGKTERKRRCTGGRKVVRDALYMAAFTAIRMKHTSFATFYQRLRAAGKPFKVAVIATARKILTTLNAIVRDKDHFRNQINTVA